MCKKCYNISWCHRTKLRYLEIKLQLFSTHNAKARNALLELCIMYQHSQRTCSKYNITVALLSYLNIWSKGILLYPNQLTNKQLLHLTHYSTKITHTVILCTHTSVSLTVAEVCMRQSYVLTQYIILPAAVVAI